MRKEPKRWTTTLTAWIATWSITMMLAVAPLAHAGETAPATTQSWGQLFGYIGCAMGIAFATSSGQLWAAGLGCARLLLGELDI